MTRLRTTAGISREEYEKQYLLPFDPLEQYLEKCRDNRMAGRSTDGHWYLTPEGFLVSNSIITDLLILQEESTPLAKRRM